MQVFILDSLAQYNPVDSKDAEAIIERVTPRLQHANSAVVLSAIKVILHNMDVSRWDLVYKTCHSACHQFPGHVALLRMRVPVVLVGTAGRCQAKPA